MPRTHRIVVHQMGRVGSTSLWRALQQHPQLNPDHVGASHRLSDDALARWRWTIALTNDDFEQRSAWARTIRRWIADHSLTIDVICPIRDPVARNISMYFFDRVRWMCEAEPHLRHQSPDDALEHFYDTFDHAAPLRWFDREVRAPFGIDVFAADARPGFGVIERGRFRMLTLNADDANGAKAETIARFLNIEPFDVPRLNAVGDNARSDTAAERELYRRVVDDTPIDPRYLDWMYTSELAQRFFTPPELEQMRTRWSRRAPKLPSVPPTIARARMIDALHANTPTRAPNERSVLIHHMGAVDAEPIRAAIAAASRSADIVVTNRLSEESEREHAWRQRREAHTLAEHHHDGTQGDENDDHATLQAAPPLVIIPITDPIARNVRLIAGEDHARRRTGPATQPLARRFAISPHHADPEAWFDREVAAPLGIDIFSEPFDHERGITQLTTPNCTLIVMRTDPPSDDAVQTLRLVFEDTTLSINPPRTPIDPNILHALRRVLTTEYIDWQLGARFARHFFSPQQREELCAFWQDTMDEIRAKAGPSTEAERLEHA